MAWPTHRIGVIALVLSGWPAFGQANNEDDEPATHAPGLVAKYQSGQRSVRTIDEPMQFDWSDRSPDPRLPVGSFGVTWSGRLFVQRPTTYTFSVQLVGSIKVTLDGKVVLEGKSDALGWVTSPPIELEFGRPEIIVEYHKTGSAAQVGLFWESRFFEREPIPPAALDHALPDVEARQARRGEQLIRALRCQACHDIPLSQPTLPAPTLTKLHDAVHPGWLTHYLQQPTAGKAGVRMPSFGIDDQKAQAITHYLLQESDKPSFTNSRTGNADDGKKLFQSVGCLACHTAEGVGTDTLFGGGDLAKIAEKRPDRFFMTWLTKPESINPNHRMPVFAFEGKGDKELASMISYLTTLGTAPKESSFDVDPKLANEGRKLVERFNCAGCHQIPKTKPAAKRPLDLTQVGCLGSANTEKRRPGYQLSQDDQQAVLTYLKELPAQPTELASAVRGRAVMDQNNCLSCHGRASAIGLRSVLPKLGVTDPKKMAALAPPSLNSVGDKLHEKWLTDAVAGKATRLRPWLAPRMPRFKHDPDQQADLVTHFLTHDRLPEAPTKPPTAPDPVSEQLVAAHRLVGSNGFGCMSCHTVGSHQPVGVELGARGSDLRNLGQRMREDFFLRWTRNPARIVAGIEMPAITLASPGLLGDSIQRQVASLWTGLNDEHFTLPTANAVQLVTLTEKDRALIVRDPVQHEPEITTDRPLLAALPNRHNVLFDLDRGTLIKWWVGDAARMKSQGKTNYWESAGLSFFDQTDARPMVVLRIGDKTHTTLDRTGIGHLIEHSHPKPDEIQFVTLLSFTTGDDIYLTTDVRPRDSGVSLHFTATNLPKDAQLQLVLPKALMPTDPKQQPYVGASAIGSFHWQPRVKTEAPTADPLVLPMVVTDRRAEQGIDLWTSVMPPAPGPGRKYATSTAKRMNCLPGYTVDRLAINEEPMPTDMVFNKRGELYACSMLGGVYKALDRDKDGEFDDYQRVSDYYAAPFGMLADGDDLLLCHKHELLRLRDRDRDGFFETAATLATGWGVTYDYHDWLVGLVRDKQGRLFISTCVQQNDRPLEQAQGRGKVFVIEPVGGMKEFAAGMRFCMGLAVNDDGDLFGTDNQGNTNPFNELNHIQPGRHYGFWNKLEPRPKGQQVTNPAICLPHPLTRSVNRITFIPKDGKFGPFAGHLIGADYTTRSLNRMSLQRVGDSYQGASYPFSDVDADMLQNDQTFFGPMGMTFAPDGSLYLAGLVDSGWGGGNNRGTLERIRFTGSLPFGIREVRAHAGGFDLDFTQPALKDRAAVPTNYTVSCYRRINKGGYATDDQDRSDVAIAKVDVAADGKSARLHCPLKPGFVYDIAIGKLAGDDVRPFPALAAYTLNAIPK